MKQSFEDVGIILPAAPGEQVYISCPKCSYERKKKNAKCLSVDTKKEVWHCWHCGWVGGLQGMQRQTGMRQPQQREPIQYRRPEPTPKPKLSAAAVKWLTSRAITTQASTAGKLESASVYFPQLEDTAEAIVFPYFKDSQLINRKYRTIEGKNFRMEAGCELCLYGLDDIKPDQPLIFVEGEMDKLALETAGFTNVVSVPNGAPPVNTKGYETKFTFLDAAADKLTKVRKFILAVDNDPPGAFLEVELARRLGTDICWRVKWPENCKDANEVLMKHGAEDLGWYVKNPEPFPIEGAFGTWDRKDDLHRLYEYGFEEGQKTGWRILDRYFTVKPGELTVVTGLPSSGKSNFVDALAVNLARLHQWRFAIFSPENLPLEQHMAAIMEKYCNKPFEKGWSQRMSPTELDQAINWTQDHFSWIMPGDEDDWTVEKILQTAGRLCLRYGIRGLVIDPWNELESLRPKEMTETEYISKSLKQIKIFCRTKAVHVIVVIHPTKLIRGKNGQYPIPSLYDCAGSAHWRNKADNGLTVWRELSKNDSPEVDIHIQKIRFRRTGHRGMAQLFYQAPCATYAERADQQQQFGSWTDYAAREQEVSQE